ncbi:MAG: iron-containing alcohol dehydrogenase [Mycobacterium sp.]|nr:iron-containing alcohol dehydrogenase [Mycobacterium sp.]
MTIPDIPDATETFGLLRLPDRIAFGFGAVRSVPETAARLGRRAFVCCDPFLEHTPGFYELLDRFIAAGIGAEVWTKIIPELPVDSIEAAANAARACGPDLIIGFGGGSSLDLAKLVALLLSHSAIWDGSPRRPASAMMSRRPSPRHGRRRPRG